jgi:Uma2 family endonuclease
MSAIAPVLTKERMTHEEFMDWCDEDTKADLIEGVIVVQTPLIRVGPFLVSEGWIATES